MGDFLNIYWHSIIRLDRTPRILVFRQKKVVPAPLLPNWDTLQRHHRSISIKNNENYHTNFMIWAIWFDAYSLISYESYGLKKLTQAPMVSSWRPIQYQSPDPDEDAEIALYVAWFLPSFKKVNYSSSGIIHIMRITSYESSGICLMWHESCRKSHWFDSILSE